jgi:hypothetical protein
MKLIFAALVVAAIAVPLASATAYVPVQLWIAGSSAEWQTMALGAYNGGVNFSTASPNTSTCHYTAGVNFNVTDTRQSNNTVDSNGAWVVWSVPHTGTNTAVQDCTAANSADSTVEDIWVFVKVDSVNGVRCYFAAPACTIQAPSPFPAAGSKIGQALWGDNSPDSTPSPAVQAFLIAGAKENVAAADIRPEDAAWAQCRVNSPLGNSSIATGTKDSLDGLGYSQSGATQTAGVCPAYSANIDTDLTNGIGKPINSGYPGAGATDVSHVLAFNITGKDPLTNTKVPAYTTYPVGAAPIVFLVNNTNGSFTGATNATDRQLQQVFSGADCNASVFQGAAGGPINAFLREPLSGTYNTTEATVMRYPTTYGSGGVGVIGTSMETGVGTTNTLGATLGTCSSGGGNRYRAIGTSEEVKSVQNSASAYGANNRDGIGFTFFSYGNVSTLADQTVYAYLQLNGVDPIWASYNGLGDPGQPATKGELPGSTEIPNLPACENSLWKGGFSLPNVRNGTYRAWSDLRMISTGAAGTNAGKLITNSNKYVVTSVPDYVPAAKVTLAAGNACTSSITGNPAFTDAGLTIARSHYQQEDGAGTLLGVAPVNEPLASEKGGDMGGLIIPLALGAGVTTTGQFLGEKETQTVQGSDTAGGLGPYSRP